MEYLWKNLGYLAKGRQLFDIPLSKYATTKRDADFWTSMYLIVVHFHDKILIYHSVLVYNWHFADIDRYFIVLCILYSAVCTNRVVSLEQTQHWGLLSHGLQCHYTILLAQGKFFKRYSKREVQMYNTELYLLWIAYLLNCF